MSADEARQKLLRIIGPLVDDIMSLSDDEVILEVRDEGRDPATVAASAAGEIASAIAAAGRARLAEARAHLDGVTAFRHGSGVVGKSLREKEQILQSFAANDGPLRSRLTMAARSGEGLTEEEVDSILLDLIELGALEADNNASE